MNNERGSDSLRLDSIYKLADQYGFNGDDLVMEVNRLNDEIQTSIKFSNAYPMVKERGRHLGSINKLALELAGKLEKLQLHTLMEITDVLNKNPELVNGTNGGIEKYFSKDPGLSVYSSLLHRLYVLAEAAQVVNKGDYSRKKYTKYKPGDLLILGCSRMWTSLTGSPATYTTNWDSGERQGEFINFMVCIARIIGIDPAPLPERFRRLKEKGDI